MKNKILGVACVLLGTVSAAAFADEGMWLPGQAPELAGTMKEAGFDLPGRDLADLSSAPMNAIASLGGCSAAFLSPDGLIATNHHCVYGSIQYNSTPERDYTANGFLAASRADELPAAPGSRVYVIEELRDVTREMLGGVTLQLDGLARYERLEKNRKALIAGCEKQPNRRCEVSAYFGGAAYYLQRQLEIRDIRLVYAPSAGIGNFGGEIDNWMWPRHTGDFGFYRAYVAADGSSAPYSANNVPYRPKAFLKPAKEGVREGDFIMVAGFPGTTERARSAGEAQAYFAAIYPKMLKYLSDYAGKIESLTAGDPGAQLKYASILKGTNNYKKKIEGQLNDAEAIALLDKKKAREDEFRAWIAADGKRAATLDPVLKAFDAAAAEDTAAAAVRATAALLNRAQLLAAARDLYRWAKEREKPDDRRESGFQDRDAPFLKDRLKRIERQFVPAIDRKLFEQALAEYNQLSAADRNSGLDKLLPEIGFDRLYAETTLGDTGTRLAWMERPASAFEASADPFIRLAVAMYGDTMAAEKKAKDRAGRIQPIRAAYMSARRDFARATGKMLYPDANGSLRFTYGTVRSKNRDGIHLAAFTTAGGIAEKATGREPFAAPEKELGLIRAKDFGSYAAPALGTLPVDFLSTADITNGNSGSSTLNAKGEFVGLAFDGTIEGIISDWWYDPAVNRTIHVDSRYMFWVMDKVDHADALLAEIGVKK